MNKERTVLGTLREIFTDILKKTNNDEKYLQISEDINGHITIEGYDNPSPMQLVIASMHYHGYQSETDIIRNTGLDKDTAIDTINNIEAAGLYTDVITHNRGNNGATTRCISL